MSTPASQPLPRLDRLTESGVYAFQQAVQALLEAEKARLDETEATVRNHLLLEQLFKGESHDEPR